MNEELWQLTVKTVFQDGFFVGLEKLRQGGKLSAQDVGKVRATLFKYLSARVAEAQREVGRIQTVLAQLNGICHEGQRPAPVELVFSGPVNQLGSALQALDGWVVSLYETDLTMTGIVNPTLRRQQAQAFSRAIDHLWQKREAELSGVKDPSLFAAAWS